MTTLNTSTRNYRAEEAATTSSADSTSKTTVNDATTECAMTVSFCKYKSPWQVHMDHIKAIQDNNKDMLGPVLVRGLAPKNVDENDDCGQEKKQEEEEEGDNNAKNLTQGEVDSLRYVFLTTRRKSCFEAMHRLVLGDQADSEILTFDNTTFRYHIKRCFYRVIKPKYSALRKSPRKRFDLLFAYTHTIMSYNVWMRCCSGAYMVDFVKDLAKMWKGLLKKSNDDLGIDAAYSRPGIVSLLDQFKEQVEDALNMYSEETICKFKYQPRSEASKCSSTNAAAAVAAAAPVSPSPTTA